MEKIKSFKQNELLTFFPNLSKIYLSISNIVSSFVFGTEFSG